MKLRGSITVLLSFVLVFVTGLFFTMSEVVRYYCLRDQSARAAALACESTLADYCRPLWEEFGILGLDGGYGAVNFRRNIYEDRLSEYMEKNGRSDGMHFFRAYPADADLVAFSLLTDDGGAGLVREAALHMKENLPAAALSAVRDNSRSSLSEADGLPSMDEFLGSGRKAMDAAEENRHRGADEGEAIPEGLKTLETVDGTEPDEATKRQLEAAENPVDTVGNINTDGILDLVLPEGTQISGAAFTNSDLPSKRARHTGNGRGQGPELNDLVWYRLWQMDKLQNYRRNLGRPGFQYEVEYVICGRDSDRENLKGTVHRITGPEGGRQYGDHCFRLCENGAGGSHGPVHRRGHGQSGHCGGHQGSHCRLLGLYGKHCGHAAASCRRPCLHPEEHSRVDDPALPSALLHHKQGAAGHGVQRGPVL